MKDLDTWFYVIIFVFYVGAQIWKGLKKAKQSPPAPQPEVSDTIPVGEKRRNTVEKRRKKFSFDDLLKEFENGFEQERQPEQAVDLPPEVSEEYVPPVYEGLEHYTPELTSSFDEEKNDPVIEGLTSTDGGERSEKYKIHKEKENPFAKIFHEPDGARKAIILSEILNRKYS